MTASTHPTDHPEPRLLVQLCTYNEAENLAHLIPQIFAAAPQADLVVIDDHSPDGTSDYVRSLMPEDKRIHLITRMNERGLGSATIAGFRYAIDEDYDLLLTMDADHSHPPRYIPDLLKAAKRADVAIGSRYVPGGGVVGWNLKRKMMSWCINIYSRLLLGLPNKDNSGNFRCYRVDKLAELDFEKIRSGGYSFMEEILYRCHRIGCQCAETPIVFEDRTIGESKINMGEAWKALWVIFRLFLDRVAGKEVRKTTDS
ncbi:MAG: polyprenol monophosphomannose synthase [Planctomycetaceae bacterium]|nr:polyprenol monophosphomannose synthase [Planctomycetaceae bacterium]